MFRDFWSDACVKDMVSCSFVFWQQLDTSEEGKNFVETYKVTFCFVRIVPVVFSNKSVVF
jgi:hypothetical protein